MFHIFETHARKPQTNATNPKQPTPIKRNIPSPKKTLRTTNVNCTEPQIRLTQK